MRVDELAMQIENGSGIVSGDRRVQIYSDLIFSDQVPRQRLEQLRVSYPKAYELALDARGCG